MGVAFSHKSGLLALGMALGAIIVAGGRPARADTLYHSLLPTGETAVDVGQYAAQSFGTGSSASTLDSVSLLLRTLGKDNVNTFSLYLYDATGAGGAPGSQIASIGTHTLRGGVSPDGTNYTSYPELSFNNIGMSLAANQQYYLVVKNDFTSQGDQIFWKNSSSAASTSLVNSPVLYNYISSNSLTWSSCSAGSLNMMVMATAVAVPEPSTYALAAIGSVIMAALARRRKKQVVSPSVASTKAEQTANP